MISQLIIDVHGNCQMAFLYMPDHMDQKVHFTPIGESVYEFEISETRKCPVPIVFPNKVIPAEKYPVDNLTRILEMEEDGYVISRKD